MTIHKFPLQLTDLQQVAMPEGARVLTAQVQSSLICLWASVDPAAKQVNRCFVIAGTGEPIDGSEQYIGTVQQGGYVWHVFEVVR